MHDLIHTTSISTEAEAEAMVHRHARAISKYSFQLFKRNELVETSKIINPSELE